MPTNRVSANYKKMTVIHKAEELPTSSANEHGPETKGTRVKIPGVNIPEFVESIISVEIWRRGSSKQVLAERVKQESPGGEAK